MSTSKNLSVAFLGALVPDTTEYQNIAFTRSGNMAQEGIVNGLYKQGVNLTVFSLRPIASFPKDKILFCGRKVIEYRKSLNIILIPFVNLIVLKTVLGAIYEFFALIKWAIKNRNNERCIIVYNTYTPPLPFVYWIGKITNSKSVAILYDLGMPPKQSRYSRFIKTIYRGVEFFAKRYIPRLDGRIVINEAIARDYAPGKHYILVDGGIGNNILTRLFNLKVGLRKKETIFLIAGTLSPSNGTRMIKEAMLLNKNPNIKVWFAGKGRELDYVKQLTKEDSRIEYKGMLNLNQLFELYKKIDVLMNLRVTADDELYLFPSKILEYLTVGKFVLTTSTAHIESEYGKFCSILDDNSPQTLALMMEKITNMSSSELIEKGIKSRKFMIETHTWDQQSLKILNYINNNVL